MAQGTQHALARRLLGWAGRLAPAEARDWAAAMSAELEQIEPPRTALAWAAGCAWLLRRAFRHHSAQAS